MIITMAPSRPASALQLTCWILLLALLAASWQSTARASRLLTPFQQSFYSASNSERPLVIRAELLHRDHPLSPLAPAEGTTLTDRWAAAVERSSNLIASRGRRLANFQTPVTRKGGFQGEYVMSISFGTPPQKFTGLVDTGSGLVWVQCVKCAGCFNFAQRDPLYDPLQSSSEMNISCSDARCTYFPDTLQCTLSDTSCRFQYGYGDGSTIQGALLTENLTLSNTGAGGDPTASEFVMGCMNNNTGIFDNYDGIIGFSRDNYSLPSQLSRISYLPVFSYCLVPFMAATTNISSLLLGSSDITKTLVYSPILQTGNYYVNMTGISVNGVTLNIPASLFEYDSTATTGTGVIFDSGTPLTLFVPGVYDPFREAIVDAINSSYTTVPVPDQPNVYCFDITGVATPVYPTVTFHFGALDGSVLDFNLADENVFGPYTGKPGVSCLAVWPDKGTMIIGSIAQANHYIETDVVKESIGWITQDCTV